MECEMCMGHLYGALFYPSAGFWLPGCHGLPCGFHLLFLSVSDRRLFHAIEKRLDLSGGLELYRNDHNLRRRVLHHTACGEYLL